MIKIQKNTCSNIERTANAVQCHSLLSGHYDCHDLRFSIVGNINKFTTVHKNLSTLVKTRPSNQCLTQILMVEPPGNIKNNYTYQAGEQHGSDVSGQIMDLTMDGSRIGSWIGSRIGSHIRSRIWYRFGSQIGSQSHCNPF